MSDETIQQIVQQAVGQSYKQWAAQHPALSAVIDRVRVSDLAVASLRNSPEYRQAVADYTQGMTELNLLAQLMKLAGPIIAGLLM
jgi:hypothetical protein